MPRYLIQGSYTSAAASAFVSHPQDRAAGVQTAAEKLGGKLESIEFSLGEHDVHVIVALAAQQKAHNVGYKAPTKE